MNKASQYMRRWRRENPTLYKTQNNIDTVSFLIRQELKKDIVNKIRLIKLYARLEEWQDAWSKARGH